MISKEQVVYGKQMDNPTCLYSVKIIGLWVFFEDDSSKAIHARLQIADKGGPQAGFSWMEEALYRIFWFCFLSPLSCHFGWGAFTMDFVYKNIQ